MATKILSTTFKIAKTATSVMIKARNEMIKTSFSTAKEIAVLHKDAGFQLFDLTKGLFSETVKLAIENQKEINKATINAFKEARTSIKSDVEEVKEDIEEATEDVKEAAEKNLTKAKKATKKARKTVTKKAKATKAKVAKATAEIVEEVEEKVSNTLERVEDGLEVVKEKVGDLSIQDILNEDKA